MSAPAPSVRVSGGTPAGAPDYKPINRMSRAEAASILARSIRPALFQVWVDSANQGFIPVGPKCPRGVADSLASEIRKQILLGRERAWNNPQVVSA